MFVLCFISQWMKKDQNMAFSFSRQRNPNMEKALFDWPIVLQYDVKEISRKFFGHEVCLPARSLSQPKPRCVCIRFIHQSNRSISVRLLFLFCSRVFISRSYENRSNSNARKKTFYPSVFFVFHVCASSFLCINRSFCYVEKSGTPGSFFFRDERTSTFSFAFPVASCHLVLSNIWFTVFERHCTSNWLKALSIEPPCRRNI